MPALQFYHSIYSRIGGWHLRRLEAFSDKTVSLEHSFHSRLGCETAFSQKATKRVLVMFTSTFSN